MKWDEIDRQTCSVARALSEIGDRWTMLIVRDAFLRARRFEEFAERSGASRNIVADRLDKLVKARIFEQRLYQEKPDRYEYRLTEKGRELFPVLLTLVRWGDKWFDDGEGVPTKYFHTCGHQMQGRVACSECGEPLDLQDTRIEFRYPDRPYWKAY